MSLSTLNFAVLDVLERAINGALSLDSVTRERIASLSPTVFRIECVAPQFTLVLIPGVTEVRIVGYFEESADVTVSGAASDFLALLAAEDKASALINGNLKIIGDSSRLLALEKALAALDIDWEQHLATVIGDIPAHQIGRAIRQGAQFRRSAHRSFERHIREFIHEEARLSPPRIEVDDFLDAVQQLGLQTDRAEAGIRRLKRRAAALEQRIRQRGSGT